MANNEITGPGQATQVTVVGGGQQYRPSVNYSMPVMQPRQRFQMPDIDVGSSINIDLSPIADAMVKSSELKAKKAEKESEDALANIYNSYARDVNEISGEFSQGYVSMEQAQARFRKLNDNVLRVPGIDASKIATLGSKFNGYFEDLMKTQATERIKDKQDFLSKRIEEYHNMAQFSGFSFDEIEAMLVHDNLQNVMLTNINEQLKTVTTPEEKRALESQKIALMTGNVESMALLRLQDIVKNYDGAELNEQTYQSIQAELIGFLSQQFDFQRSSQIAYSAMKKFHMGNLHIMKRMSVESRDKIAKEIETVTKNKLTAAEGELIDNLPQASILSIAKASLAKKVLPDAVFNFQNSLELQGVMKDIMDINKNTEGQLVIPAKGSLGGISTATINTMSRILQDPSTEKYTIGPTAIYLGNLSGAVRDKVVENISKDPEGAVATAKEYKEVFGKKIPVVKARLEKESKESEQNLIWDFSNRQQYMDDLENCNKEINACYHAAHGGAKEYSKRIASADLLKGVLSTNALRYDERTGTIGMVDISDYVLPPLKDEASFKDWLARNVLERGAKWMMELGQVFTGNEVQENVDSLNDWLRTVPPEYRHGAINVIFNQEIPVAGPGEKIKSTGNWGSSTMEFISKLTKDVATDTTLWDSYVDFTNKSGAYLNNAIVKGYNRLDDYLQDSSIQRKLLQEKQREDFQNTKQVLGNSFDIVKNAVKGVATDEINSIKETVNNIKQGVSTAKDYLEDKTAEGITSTAADLVKTSESLKTSIEESLGDVLSKINYVQYNEVTNKISSFVDSVMEDIQKGYQQADNYLSDQRIEHMVEKERTAQRNSQAGKDLVEGLTKANERSRVFLEGVGDVAGELFGFRDAYGSEIENAPESVDVISAPKTEFEKYVNKKRELEKLRKDMGAMGLTEEVAETDKLLADLKHPDSDIVPGINGNISIRDREAIDLGGGVHGTERSITVEADGLHYIIPTIYKDKDGVTRLHTDDEAKEHFRSYGEYLHVADTKEEAKKMAFKIHSRFDTDPIVVDIKALKHPRELRQNVKEGMRTVVNTTKPVKTPKDSLRFVDELTSKGIMNENESLTTKAIILVESSGRIKAESRKGAKGLMQIMPETWNKDIAPHFGWKPEDINDPKKNVLGGFYYFNLLRRVYKDNDQALAAYNWGQGNVNDAKEEYGDDWKNHLPEETVEYLVKVREEAKKILGKSK